jgi:quercetin dioxygenase-like cupin family protein
MDLRFSTRRVHLSVRPAAALAAAGLVAVAGPTGAALAWDTTAAPPAVVSAHSNVIAQRVVTFADGPHHWSIEQRPLEPQAEPAAWAAPAPEFVIAAHGTVVVTAGTDTYLIADGEAAFVPADTEVTAAAAGDSGAAVYLIHVMAGDLSGAPTEVGESFTPGAGAHDVDLIATVMDAGQSADVAASPTGPVLAFVTSGSAEANGAPLATGEAESVNGAVNLTNTSDGTTIAVALSIGAVFAGSTPPDPIDTTDAIDAEDDDDDDDAAPTTTDTATTAPTTEAPTTTTPVDTDNDDLTDTEEAAAGSNPAVPDTDGDGLWDGVEVHQYNTDPLSRDTDGDGLDDLDETEHGTDGRNVDSDGDGLSDGQEVYELGSNPVKIDTDSDGLTDVQELAFGTSLTNPDTDGDTMSDGDEAKQGSDPTVANG